MAFAALVIIGSVPLVRGRLRNLNSVRLHAPWFVVGALVVQIGITELFRDGPRALLVGLHLATYAAAGWFVWLNRRLPGLPLIGLGAMCNSVAITLNGGTLPASASALANAGFATRDTSFQNSGALAHPVLPWLGDILATPAWLPFRNVISVGDLVILLGVAILAHVVGHRRDEPASSCGNLPGRRDQSII